MFRILKFPGWEHIKGVIFDLPDVIDRAKLFLAKENISESRVTLLKGDILKGFPQCKEVDTIIVKNLFVIFTEDEIMTFWKTVVKFLPKMADLSLLTVTTLKPARQTIMLPELVYIRVFVVSIS